MLQGFRPIYLHWLSLDVALGAVLSYTAAARLALPQPDHSTWQAATLGLAVFTIYALDHWLDNQKRTSSTPTTPRHHFHQQHEALLIRVIAGTGLVTALLATQLPWALWRFGLLLGLVTALYLGFVWKLRPESKGQGFKEPLTALVYSAGVWGSSWVTVEPVAWESIVLGGAFGLTVFQSLLLFSHYEALSSPASPNLARRMGRNRTTTTLKLLLGTAVIACLVVLFWTESRYAIRLSIILLLMPVANWAIFTQSERLLPNERYRLWGEAVFMLPALVL